MSKVIELEREIKKLEDKCKELQKEFDDYKKSEGEKTIVNNNFYNEYIQAVLFLSKFRFESIKMCELRRKAENTTLQTIINKDHKQEHFSIDKKRTIYSPYDYYHAREINASKKLMAKEVYEKVKGNNNRLNDPDYEFFVYDGDEKLYKALNHIQDLPKSIVFSIYKFLEEILEEDAELLQYT